MTEVERQILKNQVSIMALISVVNGVAVFSKCSEKEINDKIQSCLDKTGEMLSRKEGGGNE